MRRRSRIASCYYQSIPWPLIQCCESLEVLNMAFGVMIHIQGGWVDRVEFSDAMLKVSDWDLEFWDHPPPKCFVSINV